MAFNIAQFKANIASGGGLLKKNKFLVQLNPPPAILGRSVAGINMFSINRGLEFYAESASIPGISLQTSDIRRQGVGNIEKAVYGASITDIDIRFTVDQYSDNFKFFQSWMDTIYNYNASSGTEYELEYKDAYCTTITILVFNEVTPYQPIMILDLYDAFPVSISDVGLDWGASDLMKLNVRFNFLTWNERNIPGLGIRGLGGLLGLLGSKAGRTALGVGLGIGIVDSLLNSGGGAGGQGFAPTQTSSTQFNSTDIGPGTSELY